MVELPEIKVFNTLGRRLERFEPLMRGVVRMYVCGPTVYDYTHLGHARTYVAFDAIKRYLELRGFTVIHVQNITDIDDKIIRRAREEGRDWREIVEEYSRDYFEAIESLGIRIDVSPRVTHHIKEIIEFIEILIEKGYAYTTPSGSVYFSVDKYPDYGRLSGRVNKEEWRQEEEFIKEKKKPYDFALWKAWKPGEPYWEAPWGKGRPGWHIECSVMATKYLGSSFDIHGGGQDLIFPHHENERAQSEAALGVSPWVRYWMHTGYLTIGGEKMSKSLGNIIPLREALKKWGPRLLRLWLLSAHYRSQLDFREDILEQYRAMLRRIEGAVSLAARIASGTPEARLGSREEEVARRILAVHREFHEAMSNDFNTPKALSAVMGLVKIVNTEIAETENVTLARLALRLFTEFDKVFGVLGEQAREARRGIEEDLIDLLVEVRSELRKRKLYDLADYIRDKLRSLGILLSDQPGGKTLWRYI